MATTPTGGSDAVSIIVKEVRITIAGQTTRLVPDDTDDAAKCHVFPNSYGPPSLCGQHDVEGVPPMGVGLHQNGRCTACGQPTCLTCDLLAGVNVMKEET